MAVCAQIDCPTRARVEGLCKRHYKALMHGEDIGPRVCRIEGCDLLVRARRLCRKHYNRLIRTGDPAVVRSSAPKKPRPRRAKDILAEIDLDAIASVDVDDRSWQNEAACLGADIDLFYPNDSESSGKAAAAYKRARAFCEQCPSRIECIAVNLHDDYGCWGATPNERKVIRRELAERSGEKAA